MFEEHTMVEDPALLRERLDQNGYLFLRGALPPSPLAELHRRFGEALLDAGWTLEDIRSDRPPEAEPTRACVSPERAYFDVYHQLYRLPELHSFTTSAELSSIAEALLGAQVFAHPRLVARIVFPRHPGYTTPAHQDHFQVQGTTNTLTFWVPMHDCPAEMGPLRVAPGSHFDGLRPVQPAAGASGAAVVGGEELDWVSGDFRRGDVLVFKGLTVHSGTLNETPFFRFSLDVRFQKVDESVSRLSLEFSERSDLTWSAIYENWTDRSNCYYWRDLDLIVEDPDGSVLEERNQQAFELGERGDPVSISTLQRIAVYGGDSGDRDRAERLLKAMGASAR